MAKISWLGPFYSYFLLQKVWIIFFSNILYLSYAEGFLTFDRGCRRNHTSLGGYRCRVSTIPSPTPSTLHTSPFLYQFPSQISQTLYKDLTNDSATLTGRPRTKTVRWGEHFIPRPCWYLHSFMPEHISRIFQRFILWKKSLHQGGRGGGSGTGTCP